MTSIEASLYIYKPLDSVQNPTGTHSGRKKKHWKKQKPNLYNIIQIFLCFEGNKPEFLSRGSWESPRCYITRRRRRREI